MTVSHTDPSFRANCMIVGTQKGGTSSLFRYMFLHPEIAVSRVKEIHFFDMDPFFRDGSPNYNFYHAFFKSYKGEPVALEATPTYMFLPEIADRLHQYNPNLKLIFVLRNPVDRAYSHYAMVKDIHKHETLPFSQAIRCEEERLSQCNGVTGHGTPYRRFSYAFRGMYSGQIENMLRYFPRENMLFLRSETFRMKTEESLERCFDFLGVDNKVTIPKKTLFKGSYPPMDPEDRRFLINRLADEMDRLEALLGWNLDSWRR